ncbi:tripartite tricarboxylate transporter TctB family protein [Pasteurella canis]|uniref:tripartite tricarboxylate transporter TctB family protein n=1 Tax=Pasteurella canis TaxID=753 RepID=UPI001CC48924|nr:tripartite tricarboxylate transporter TctB family protein [Pasteurella canis]UAY78761.1 tripartite tricarboxylate transporter TctB family protein [Pasteurella canis]
MKITFRQDLIGAVVFLILSITLWLLIPLQIIIDEDEGITAQTFPRLIIGLMALCSVILLIKEIIKILHKQPSKMVTIQLTDELNSLVVIFLLALYWLMLHWLPFMVSSIIFAFLMLLFFRCHNWKYYAIVASVIISIALIFEHLLHISLP